MVRVGHLERPRHERLEHLLGRRDAGDRQGALRGAVVGDVAADHLVLGRFAGQLEELFGQLPRGLDRLAAAGGEEDPVEVSRTRPVGQPFGELDGPWVRIGPQGEEGQLLRPVSRQPPPARPGRARPGRRTGRPARRCTPCRRSSQIRWPSPRTMSGMLPPCPPVSHGLVDGLAGEVPPEVVSGGVGIGRARRGPRHRSVPVGSLMVSGVVVMVVLSGSPVVVLLVELEVDERLGRW